jgi:hypothetical protein
LRAAPSALTVQTVTSTPPRPSVPAQAFGSAEHVSTADRFFALVDHARAAVQDALAADAAARARRADAGHAVSTENAEDSASAEDAAIVPTQLERVVGAMLSGHEATAVMVQVVG